MSTKKFYQKIEWINGHLYSKLKDEKFEYQKIQDFNTYKFEWINGHLYSKLKDKKFETKKYKISILINWKKFN